MRKNAGKKTEHIPPPTLELMGSEGCGGKLEVRVDAPVPRRGGRPRPALMGEKKMQTPQEQHLVSKGLKLKHPGKDRTA